MNKSKIKLAIIFGVEFVAVVVILLLIFFAGKKSYTVTFDLDGGTLISGDLVQEVMQGGSATPPTAAKDGCYLHSWSASYKQVTRDITVRAVWEWETTVGIVYSTDKEGESSDWCEVIDSYSELRGDVFIGAYNGNKRVLGIKEGAFSGREGITHVYMLNGLISIGKGAFEDCTGLESVVLPSSLAVIGEGAFKNCTSLKSITIPKSVEVISDDAFLGCTALEEIIVLGEESELPSEDNEEGSEDAPEAAEEPAPEGGAEPVLYNCSKLRKIGKNAFADCIALESVLLTDTVLEIGEGAFSGCTSLAEITLPALLESVGVGAFDTDELVINIKLSEDELPVGFVEGWQKGATLVFDYVAPAPAPDGDAEGDGDNK